MTETKTDVTIHLDNDESAPGQDDTLPLDAETEIQTITLISRDEKKFQINKKCASLSVVVREAFQNGDFFFVC